MILEIGFLVVGFALIGGAAVVGSVALTEEPRQIAPVTVTYVVFRVGAGVAAIVLALSRSPVALLVMVALLLSELLLRSLWSRRDKDEELA